MSPLGPCGPVSPVSPFGPCGPISPVSPFGPCGPVSPVSPFGPLSPFCAIRIQLSGSVPGFTPRTGFLLIQLSPFMLTMSSLLYWVVSLYSPLGTGATFPIFVSATYTHLQITFFVNCKCSTIVTVRRRHNKFSRFRRHIKRRHKNSPCRALGSYITFWSLRTGRPCFSLFPAWSLSASSSCFSFFSTRSLGTRFTAWTGLPCHALRSRRALRSSFSLWALGAGVAVVPFRTLGTVKLAAVFGFLQRILDILLHTLDGSFRLLRTVCCIRCAASGSTGAFGRRRSTVRRRLLAACCCRCARRCRQCAAS